VAIETFVAIVILCDLCDHGLSRETGHEEQNAPQRTLRF